MLEGTVMTPIHTVRACLITNPKSGKGGIDLTTVLPVLAAHGWQVDVRQKMNGGHATELARSAVAEGYDVVVAGGGDGTVGEIVDGVVGSEIAVGVLPGGTANLWAHELGVSMDLAEAARQLVGAQRRRVDVGRVTINGGHGQHFLLMAGLGIDAAVLTRLSKRWKGRLGMLAYLPAIGRALPTTKPFAATLDLDGVSRQIEALQIVVGNTRRYASVASVTPDALVDDGQLDVCVLSPGNALSATQQISTLVLRKRPSPISAVNDRVGMLTVRTNDIIPLQADGGRIKQKNGEVGSEGVTYEFTLRTQALTALVPREYSGELFRLASGTEPLRRVQRPVGTKPRKSLYRIVSVGIDTLTVARERDGKVATIKLTPTTRLQTNDGNDVSKLVFFGEIGEGALIKVTGKRNKGTRTIIARRIRA
jgi:YegS/Rv2252/BmrU family lipid kinase